jgi:hypothetical protein
MADETFKLVEKMSEAPTFVQNNKQSEQPATEEFALVGPTKSPDMLDYLKEPVQWVKSGMAGAAWGLPATLKTADLIPEVEPYLDPMITVLDEGVKWWEPKEDAPGKISNWIRGASRSIGQSISSGFAGAIIGAGFSKTVPGGGRAALYAKIAASTVGAILNKGGLFAGAQYYDLTKDIEKEMIAVGANAEEIAAVQKEAAAWKTASAVSEAVGEIGPDLISARVFGLIGNPVLREPIKKAIMTGFGKFAKKMGWAQLSQGVGEQFTTAVQYKAAEEIGLPQSSYWKQVEDTAGITGIQTLIMGAGASAVASTRGRSVEALKQDLKVKTSAALVGKGVDKDTADTIADTIIKKATKTDAADNAISELEDREKVKKATKGERAVRKGELKKKAAEKSKDIIKTILAPEIPTVEGLEFIGVQRGVPNIPDKYLFNLTDEGHESTLEIENPTVENLIKERDRKRKEYTLVEEFAGETVPTIKLKDGTIIKGEPGQQHFAIADAHGIAYEDVVEQAFIDKTGKYTGAKVTKPTIPQEGKTAREEKLAKLKGEKPLYRTTPTLETAAREVTEVALPKQEVTFVKLAPSETAEIPDVIVRDQSGQSMIFNPDIHIMDEANMKAAKKDLENWTPTERTESTRERRIRILKEAGRMPEPSAAVTEVKGKVEEAATAAEVVAIVKKLRPGFVEHVNAMSKKGWTIDDFINDPDIKADLEGIVPEDKYYDLIMDIKDEIGAMTSLDILDRQIRDEQRTLDTDFAAIDKMRDEDRMQNEPTNYDEYYDVEQHKWIQLEKEAIADNIENQFIEPPPAVERVPIVIQVPPETKKVYSRKVIDNTIWFQPKEEAMTQLDLLKQIKLDHNSDIDTLLHVLTTQTNVAYHTAGEVPFTALKRLESNLDYFKKNLTHDEYNRLVNSLNSLKSFMVDVSDAIKAIDEPAQPASEAQPGVPSQERAVPAPPSLSNREKYNTAKRGVVAADLMNILTPAKISTVALRPQDATVLVDFVLNNKETFSPTITALAEVYNTPYIRKLLGSVKAVVRESSIGAGAFYLNKSPIGTMIGFSPDYAEHVTFYISSVGEDIMHEVTHALTYEIMRSSPTVYKTIKDLRMKAIEGLPENDRRIIQTIAGPAEIYEKGILDMGFSNPTKLGEVYYGLLNNDEFLSTIFSSPTMQQYLSTIPAESDKVDGKVLTLWDRFREIISWAFFNKPMGEREATLLDVALKVGQETIEVGARTAFVNLAYEATSRSEVASVPRIKSIDVEQALQQTPLKGSGIHAGAGTPIQRNVNIIEKPIDVTQLATRIESPLFALRDHPDALKFAAEAIDSLGMWSYNRSIGFMELDRITKDLNEREREKVTSLMKEIESGEVIDLSKLDPKIKTAVTDTRKFLDAYKVKHKKFLRESLILSANSTEARIMADVLIGGASVLDATKKWNRYARAQNRTPQQGKTATTTYADMLNLFKEWKEIESFGIKDYVTHAMRGSIALSDPEGHIISFAQTKRKAVEEALRYLKENPTVESIEVDTTYRLDKDFQTLVSQKYYRAMKGKIAKIIGQYSKEIGKDLSDKLKAELPGKGISIKPQKIWSQFLQEREEELPGERDIFDILPLYVHSIEKKHAIDPYIMKLRDHLHEFSDRPAVKRVLEKQLEAIRGQYTQGDAIIDDLLNKLGFETSFAYTRGLAATRTLLTNLKLGYRPIASLINLLSGMGHIWVKTSAKYMIEGQRTLNTEGGKEFIKKNAPSLGTSIIEGMGGDLENRLRWYSPLKMFQAPEIPNRELSFMTSYLVGRGEFGHDETTAVEFAKRSVDLQEFNYSVAALPEILRGPGGKTIGQFKAYLVKEIEFIRGLKGANQWAKYLTMQAVLGGPRGMMITLKSLPFLMLVGGDRWLDDLDTWLNNNYPKLSRGVFGFFGIDASGPAAFQFPTRFEDWAGILISDIVKFGKEVAAPIANGESYIWEDLKKYSKGVVPVWRLWNEFWQGLMNEDGWILDDNGNNKFKVESWTDLAKMVGGFKPLKMSVQELEMRMSTELEKRERAQASKIIEQVVKRHRMIDVDIITEELIQEFAMHATNPDSIIAAIGQSHLDPATRQLLSIKLARRMDLWQRQLPMREFRGY